MGVAPIFRQTDLEDHLELSLAMDQRDSPSKHGWLLQSMRHIIHRCPFFFRLWLWVKDQTADLGPLQQTDQLRRAHSFSLWRKKSKKRPLTARIFFGGSSQTARLKEVPLGGSSAYFPPSRSWPFNEEGSGQPLLPLSDGRPLNAASSLSIEPRKQRKAQRCHRSIVQGRRP